MENIKKYLDSNQDNIIETLKQIVEYESPSNNKKLTDNLCDYLEGLFSTVAEVKRIRQEEVGDNLKIEFGTGQQQILILCHMDTVWNEGEIFNRPFTVCDDKIYGPGIYDMKYSIVQVYYVLQILKDLDVDLNYKILIFINSDEEIGSKYSFKYIEDEAQKSKCVIALETSVNGWITTNRKGINFYSIQALGKESHAGGAHSSGINAIKEIAHQVLEIEDINNWDDSITVNTGIIRGGTRHNVVPEEAEIEVDVRYWTQDQANKVDKKIRNLEPKAEGAKLEIHGKVKRPPLEQTRAGRELYLLIKNAGKKAGINIEEGYVGGASDASYTGALRIPTVDGMGAIGKGAHSKDEYISKEKISERILLLLITLIDLSKCDLNFNDWEEFV